jgi:PIN domain nuclease of toxin-antitoxin system
MEVAREGRPTVIALDTHALLWWTLQPGKLGRRARSSIDETDRIGIPVIVFWEVALLARGKRVDLGRTVADWTRSVLALSRVEPLPLTPEIAVQSAELGMHADPADRFIVATARQHGCSLVSKDAAIRRAGLVSTIW